MDKTSHVSSVVFEGKCNCSKNYIDGKEQHVTTKWDKHSDISKNSEPAKYLYQFPEHIINWKILRRIKDRKILE